MKYKVQYIDSDIQKEYVPKLIKGRDLQFLRIEHQMKMQQEGKDPH